MIRKNDLTYETSFLEKCLANTSFELAGLKKNVPDDARLRAVRNGNSIQFFLRRGSETNGEYIKKENKKTAAILAQIEYDEKLKYILQNSITALNHCQETGVADPFVTALEQLSPYKRPLVKLPYSTDESYLAAWKNTEYKGLAFPDGSPEYYNRNGLRVRSKSEVIITDILDEIALPFLYEKPLLLKTGLVYPDITLLNIKQRKEVYWEHFGMMDDADYRNNAFFKIRKYEANGFFPPAFIWTFETGKFPLNVKEIRQMAIALKSELGYNV